MPIPRQLCLLMLVALAACKSTDEDKDNRTGQAQLIGVIEMVNPEQNYVLINCSQRRNLPPGTELIALDSAGAKSKLLVTPEKKENYITADIKEGHPTVSSLVLQKIRDSDTLPPPPVPGAPQAAPTITPEFTQATGGSLPPIPEIVFPGPGAPPQQSQPLPPLDDSLPLPKPLVPASEQPPPLDLSKFPPVIR